VMFIFDLISIGSPTFGKINEKYLYLIIPMIEMRVFNGKLLS